MKNHKNRGAVLILSLWVLLFLGFITLLLGRSVRQQILAVKKIEDRQKIRDVSDAGMLFMLNNIVDYFKQKEEKNADSLNEKWADNPDLYKKIQHGAGDFSFEYKSIDNITGSGKLCYGVMDEERKLNINYANSEDLGRLLVNEASLDKNEAYNLAGAIIDWRDTDDILYNKDSMLSEKDYYRSKECNFSVQNTFFVNIEELLFVCGMDLNVFFKIRDYITVYGNNAVNINTASRVVLKAIGLSDYIADNIIWYRCGTDKIEGTVDDNIFYDKMSIVADLEKYCDLSKDDKRELNHLAATSFLDTKSNTFTILCTARIDSSVSQGKTICVINKSGQIRYWGYKLIKGVE
jgi:type II secretory pathway component PulK